MSLGKLLQSLRFQNGDKCADTPEIAEGKRVGERRQNLSG
jgi:hypothetical protein